MMRRNGTTGRGERETELDLLAPLPGSVPLVCGRPPQGTLAAILPTPVSFQFKIQKDIERG